MTKIVQIAGGESTTEDLYIGPERELRADESNDELRLHNGSKPGGFRFLNMDANDGRYQFRSEELDGFDFASQSKGFLTRISPGNYKLRELKVQVGQLTIENPLGLLGNPLIGLAAEITTDHTFSGLIEFTNPITATGGVVGNLTGDSAGTHTGPVVGDVTGDLTGDANGNHTGSFTGDVDVRGQTLLLDDNQISPAKITNLLDYLRQNLEEVGIIKIWSGAVVDIPDYWALCDGNNGTPDLTDKFVIGAGDSYDPLETGGTASHTHTGSADASGSHSHSLTIAGHALSVTEMPAHRHLMCAGSSGSVTPIPDAVDIDSPIRAGYDTGGAFSYNLRYNTSVEADRAGSGLSGSNSEHTHAGSSADSAGSHSHTITVDSASSLPPYFALCYIMKVG